MNLKNLIFGVVIAATMGLFAGCQSTGMADLSTSAPKVEHSATAAPAATSATPPTPDPSPTLDAQMALSQTVDGMEINMRNIRRGDGQLKADICHPLPDSDTWFLGHIVLKYGDTEVREWVGSTEQPDTPAGNGNMDLRCMTAAFKVLMEETLGEFRIIVETLESPPRPDQVCTRLDSGKETLAAAGLFVECSKDGGYSVNSAQSTVSEEEAMRILHDLEFRTIRGPWEFWVKLH